MTKMTINLISQEQHSMDLDFVRLRPNKKLRNSWLRSFLSLLFLMRVAFGQTTNNINLCKGQYWSGTATLTRSGGSAAMYSIENKIWTDSCDYCEEFTVDGSGDAWLMLDLGSNQQISTIMFLGDWDDSTDYGSSMVRYAGPSATYNDPSNTQIIQDGGTNYLTMIADINDGAPKSVRYIHWRLTGSNMSVNQILCYEKKRMYDTDMSDSYDYILPKNGGIQDPSSCSSIGNGNNYLNYNGYHTVWRTIVYNDRGIWSYGDDNFEKFEMDKDNSAAKHQCVLDMDQHGYDCYTNTINNANFPHDRMKVETRGNNSHRQVCAIVLLEEANDCSDASIASQMVSAISYNIGDPAVPISVPSTVTVNSCATTCTVTSSTPAWWDSTNSQITTSDYSITTGTVVDTSLVFTATGHADCTETHTVAVTFTNSCTDSSIASLMVSTAQYTIGDPAVPISVPSTLTVNSCATTCTVTSSTPAWWDSTNSQITTSDYSITNGAVTYIDSSSLTFTASGHADCNEVHTVAVTFTNTCTDVSIASQMVSAESYTIGDPAVSVSVPATVTVNLCSTTCTISSSGPAWWDSTNKQIQSSDYSITSSSLVDSSLIFAATGHADCTETHTVAVTLTNTCTDVSIASQMVSAEAYTIGNPAVPVSVPSTVTVNSCATTCTVTSSSPAWWDNANKQIATSDYSITNGAATHVDSSSLTFTATGHADCNEVHTVAVTFTNTCTDVSIASQMVSAESYTIGDSAVSVSVPATVTVNLCSTTCSVSSSGPAWWDSTNKQIQSSDYSITNGATTHVDSSSLTFAATGHADCTEIHTVAVTFTNTCTDTSIASQMVSAEAYTIGDPAVSITVPSTVSVNLCSTTCTVSSSMPAWWDNTNTRIQTYDLSITGSAATAVDSSLQFTATGHADCTETHTVPVTFSNPCDTTVIQSFVPTLTQQTIYLDDSSPLTYSVGITSLFEDTVTQASGGNYDCGPKSYAFSDNALDSSGAAYLTPSQNLIQEQSEGVWNLQAFSSDGYQVGSAQVQVTVSLLYSTVTEVFSFNVIVLHMCETTTITLDASTSPINDIEILVGSGQSATQTFLLENSVAISNSDDAFCGAYQCELQQQDASALTADQAALMTLSSSDIIREQWALTAVAQTTFIAALNDFQLKVVCTLSNYNTPVFEQDFEVSVHYVSMTVVQEHHFIIGGSSSQLTISGSIQKDPTSVALTLSDFDLHQTDVSSSAYTGSFQFQRDQAGAPESFTITFTPIDTDKGTYTYELALTRQGNSATHPQKITKTIDVTFYSFSGSLQFAQQALAYLINDKVNFAQSEAVELVHSALALDPDPACSYTYQADSVVMGSTTTLTSPLFTYDASSTKLVIQSNDSADQGTHTVRVSATCQASSSVPSLVGEVVHVDLTVETFVYDMALDDLGYLLNGEVKTFPAAGIQVDLTPTNTALANSFTLQGTSSMGAIGFDQAQNLFRISSDDTSLSHTQTIQVSISSSTDSRWLGQTISTSATVYLYYTKGLEISDKVYIINGESASFTIDLLELVPSTSSLAFITVFQHNLKGVGGAFSVVPAPSYIQQAMNLNQAQISIIDDPKMVAGTKNYIRIEQTIQQNPSVAIQAHENDLIGEIKEAWFKISLYKYEWLPIEDQEYTLDGSKLTFGLNTIVFTPTDPGVIFEYRIQSVGTLPYDPAMIEFDSRNLLLTVSSSDQSLAGLYKLMVKASSEDEQWLNQSISTTFTLNVNKAESNYTNENSAPVIQGLSSNTFLTLPTASQSESDPILLGTVFDEENNPFTVTLDNSCKNFINLSIQDDNKIFLDVLSIAQTGIYNCHISLKDDSDNAASTDYKITFVISETSEDLPQNLEEILSDPLTGDIYQNVLPFVVIRGMDQYGLLTAEFSEEMEVILDLKSIDNQVIEFSVESQDKDNPGMRLFDWRVVKYNSTGCQFQFDWDNPPWISSTSERDLLVMKIVDHEKFIKPVGRSLSEEDVSVRVDGSWQIKLPPQAYRNGMVETVEQAAEVVGMGIKGYLVLNLLLHPLMLFSLSMLWDLINGIQIIAYSILFNITLPLNSLVVYRILYSIATFDLIPLTQVKSCIVELLGQYDPDTAVNLHAQAIESGLDTTNPMLNTLMALIIVFFSILTLATFKVLSFAHRKLLHLYMGSKQKMVWNHFIRLFLEEYVFIGVVCLIKISVISFTNAYQVILSTYALVVFTLAVVFPIFSLYLLIRTHKQGDIKNSNFTQKFGALTLDLRLRYKETLYFTACFQVRRLLLIWSIVMLVDYSWAQIQLIIFFNSFAMMYQGYYRPYMTSLQNSVQLANEALIMVIVYFLLLYSDFVRDRNIRYLAAWFNIGFIAIAILLNGIYIGFNNFVAIKRYFRLRKMRQAYMQQAKFRLPNILLQSQEIRRKSMLQLDGAANVLRDQPGPAPFQAKVSMKSKKFTKRKDASRRIRRKKKPDFENQMSDIVEMNESESSQNYNDKTGKSLKQLIDDDGKQSQKDIDLLMDIGFDGWKQKHLFPEQEQGASSNQSLEAFRQLAEERKEPYKHQSTSKTHIRKGNTVLMWGEEEMDMIEAKIQRANIRRDSQPKVQVVQRFESLGKQPNHEEEVSFDQLRKLTQSMKNSRSIKKGPGL